MAVFFIGEQNVKRYFDQAIGIQTSDFTFSPYILPRALNHSEHIILQTEIVNSPDLYANVRYLFPLLLVLDFIPKPLCLLSFRSHGFYKAEFNLPEETNSTQSDFVFSTWPICSKEQLSIISTEHRIEHSLNRNKWEPFFKHHEIGFSNAFDHYMKLPSKFATDDYAEFMRIRSKYYWI